MEKRFKDKLKENGQTMKWFYMKFIKKKTGLTYAGFAGQLNEYSPLSVGVREEMIKYLGE